MVTKDQFVAVLKAAGITKEQMHQLHREFERTAPEQHQEFLDFLHIPAEEAAAIRERSRA